MHPSSLARRALCGLLTGLACGAAGAQPQVATPDTGTRDEPTRAAERCEASAAETLRKLRGRRAHEVQFSAAQRGVNASDEGEYSVKGGGRYRAADGGASAGFSFSCLFNAKTGLTSGVVLRDAGSEAGRGEGAWQPDLSRISPEACESAAAHLLKEKHPRVAYIAMEPDTRRLEPGGPDEHLILRGQGAVQRAPGMLAVPFSYTCEFEPRSGRLVAVKTSV